VREQDYLHKQVLEDVINNVSLRSILTVRLGDETNTNGATTLEDELGRRVRTALERLQRKHPLTRAHATMDSNAKLPKDEFHFRELFLDDEDSEEVVTDARRNSLRSSSSSSLVDIHRVSDEQELETKLQGPMKTRLQTMTNHD